MQPSPPPHAQRSELLEMLRVFAVVDDEDSRQHSLRMSVAGTTSDASSHRSRPYPPPRSAFATFAKSPFRGPTQELSASFLRSVPLLFGIRTWVRPVHGARRAAETVATMLCLFCLRLWAAHWHVEHVGVWCAIVPTDPIRTQDRKGTLKGQTGRLIGKDGGRNPNDAPDRRKEGILRGTWPIVKRVKGKGGGIGCRICRVRRGKFHPGGR